MQLKYTIESIKQAALTAWDYGKDFKVWAFHAEMGAGKTTLIHALCEMLGVKDSISSPTYSIINQYEGSKGEAIYHMDWYRLRNEDEAIQAGVEDVLYSGSLCFVEWPEKAERLLPDDALHFYINVQDEQTRQIVCTMPAS